jgi:uncharacterized protein YndB with AHSA1/START domain
MAAIEVDQLLPRPPERVWAAPTNPALVARWLMPNDFLPVPGHEFTFRTEPVPQHGFDGVVHCQVLEVQPPRLVRFSWRSGILDTTVTWRLAAEGSGTRLLSATRASTTATRPARHHADPGRRLARAPGAQAGRAARPGRARLISRAPGRSRPGGPGR